MSEAPGCSSATVDGDADVDNVLHATEHVVEVLVGHLEGHVADEDGLGRESGAVGARVPARLGLVVLDNEAAAFKYLKIEVLNSGPGVFDVVELDVSEAMRNVSRCDWCRINKMVKRKSTYPLLMPRSS